MAPIEDLTNESQIDEEDATPKSKRTRSRLKVRIDEDAEKPVKKTRSRAKKAPPVEEPEDAADFEDGEDDALFDEPIVVATKKAKAAAARTRARTAKKTAVKAEPVKASAKKTAKPVKAAAKSSPEDDEPVEKGWKKGKQFIIEDKDDETEEEEERRPLFARRRKAEKDNKSRSRVREALRFSDDEDEAEEFDDENDLSESDDFSADFSEDEYDEDYDDEDYAAGDATIVDADWEDVDEISGGPSRGFGRRVRAKRRRATALARMDDVRRFDPDVFDDEFFASLKVTPRELEKALKKARRRAEYRDKNRMTPLRAFGWSAWVAAVAGTIYAVVAYRDEIVKIAPSTADAYAVVGIEANPYGLAIEDVRHRLAMSTGGAMIEITGSLKNDGDAVVEAPLLQAEALGPRGELLSRWTFTPSQAEVLNGASIDFSTRAPAPEGVAEVALSFAPTKSAVSGLLPGGE